MFKKKDNPDINNIITSFKKEYKLKLNLHQVYPAYYLKYLEPFQKGLLVNHYMGTGKTFTALNYFIEFKNKSAVLICESHIIENWKNEIEKLGIEIDITFITYDSITDELYKLTNLKEKILVMDDAHVFVNIMRKKYNNEQFINIYTRISEFYKILFLTGTVFYTDIYDMIYIFNMVSGQRLLPFEPKEFDELFFKLGIIDNLFVKWIFPAIKYLPQVISYSVAMVQIFWAGDLFFRLLGIEKFTTGLIGVDLFNKIQHKLSDLYIYLSKPLLNNLYNSLDINKDNFIKLGLSDNSADNFIKSLDSVLGIITLLFFTLILSKIVWLIEKVYHPEKDRLDVDGLGSIVQKYVSYYEIPNNDYSQLKVKICHNDRLNFLENIFCKSYIDKLDKSDYPVKQILLKRITYNSYQMEIYFKMIHNQLNYIEKELFGITDIDPNLFINLDRDAYLNYGRIIGNLSFKSEDHKIEFSPKFKELLKVSENNNSVVIYSNFYSNGILLFSQFLDDNKKTYKILLPEYNNRKQLKILNNFKNKKFQYLLLHPVFKDGISIEGAEQLHILEPMINFGEYEQLIYRVIRYKSHSHLETKKRKIDVYQWEAKTISFGKLLIERFKNNKAFKPQSKYWEKIKDVEDECSADSVLLAQSKKLNDKLNQFNKILKKYSIEKCDKNNSKFNCKMDINMKKLIKHNEKNK